VAVRNDDGSKARIAKQLSGVPTAKQLKCVGDSAGGSRHCAEGEGNSLRSALMNFMARSAGAEARRLEATRAPAGAAQYPMRSKEARCCSSNFVF